MIGVVFFALVCILYLFAGNVPVMFIALILLLVRVVFLYVIVNRDGEMRIETQEVEGPVQVH